MANQSGKSGPAVSLSRTVPVYPKTLHPQKTLSLSNLDRQYPLLMYLVFFYKPFPSYQNISLNSVFESLKSGLEETLSIWYPGAGRLISSPNNGGKLDVQCNNEGAVLVEATTQIKISELGDLSRYNEFLEKLVFKPVFNGDFSTMPLVAAQVTKFGCGGYSIGIGTSHSLFDGPATYDFIRAWASSSAILKEKGHLESPKPVHERGSLLGLENSSPATRAAAIEHLYQLINQATTRPSQGGCSFLEKDGSSYVLKTFHITREMIAGLMRKVLPGGTRTGFSCSCFEVVAAHLWKARTKSLGIKNERMVCLQFAADTRTRVVPPLPKGFSGNAFVLASVTLTAGKLHEQSYETIIQKVKEAKKSVSNDYVSSYLKALNGQSQTNLPPLEELTLVSDWTRIPFHKVDFLHGEAAYASPLMPPVPQVAYLMQSPKDDTAIDVRIGLLPQNLDAFSCYFFKSML